MGSFYTTKCRKREDSKVVFLICLIKYCTKHSSGDKLVVDEVTCMKKVWIVLFICLALCICGGSFLIITRIQENHDEEVLQTIESDNYEELKSFSSINFDLKTMDVKIEKSDKNAISYRLYNSKKQSLKYSVKDEALTVTESWKSKSSSISNLRDNQNIIVIYTNADWISIHGNCISSDMDIHNLTLDDSNFKTVSGDITGNNMGLKSTTISSISGDIELDGETNIQNEATFETTSGDIDIESVKDISIDASNSSGDIEIGDTDYDHSASVVIGNKNANLILRSTSGDISID